MKRNADLKVPYSPQGNLMHHPGYPKLVEGSEGELTYPEVGEWRDNESFEATLRLMGTARGRSAAFFCWEDVKTGQAWPMFITDVSRLITMAAHIEPGGVVSGRWFVVKRGHNFGLTPAPAQDGTTETTGAPTGP